MIDLVEFKRELDRLSGALLRFPIKERKDLAGETAKELDSFLRSSVRIPIELDKAHDDNLNSIEEALIMLKRWLNKYL